MATSVAGASGSLALGSADAGCVGCVDNDGRQQVKSAAQFPYSAVGAQRPSKGHRGAAAGIRVALRSVRVQDCFGLSIRPYQG